MAGVGFDDEFQYWKNDSSWANCTTITTGPVAATWYHIRLDFELTTDGYCDLGEDEYRITVYKAGTYAIHDGVEDNIGVYSAEAHIDKVHFYTSAADSGHLVYIDSIGYSWDEDSEGKTYTVGDNKHLLIDNFDVGAISLESCAGPTYTGNKAVFNILKEMSDDEGFTWALTPSLALIYRAISEDSYIDLVGTDRVWGVRGEKILKRINKVVLEGADGTLGEADNTDAQTTYGIRLYRDIRYQTSTEADLDDMADAILSGESASPQKVKLWFYSEDYGFIQPLESIGVVADTIYYAKNITFIPEEDYIVQKIKYDPLRKIIYIEMADGVIMVEPSEEYLKRLTENIAERDE